MESGYIQLCVWCCRYFGVELLVSNTFFSLERDSIMQFEISVLGCKFIFTINLQYLYFKKHKKFTLSMASFCRVDFFFFF